MKIKTNIDPVTGPAYILLEDPAWPTEILGPFPTREDARKWIDQNIEFLSPKETATIHQALDPTQYAKEIKS